MAYYDEERVNNTPTEVTRMSTQELEVLRTATRERIRRALEKAREIRKILDARKLNGRRSTA
jgi:hypothetical protein